MSTELEKKWLVQRLITSDESVYLCYGLTSHRQMFKIANDDRIFIWYVDPALAVVFDSEQDAYNVVRELKYRLIVPVQNKILIVPFY